MKSIIFLGLTCAIMASFGFVEARTVAPFLFELPDDPENYFTPESVNNGGPPELVLQKSDTFSFPLIIRSTTDSVVPVKFFATFGEQTGVPQLPPGIQVTIEPDSFTLDKNENVTMNIQIKSTDDAPNGWYFLNFVGMWNKGEFSGTGISLKVGDGSDMPLNPADFTESPLKQFNSGIAPQDVICRENLELLVKFSDGRPICVKQTTKLKLIERRIAFIYEQHGGPQGNNEIKVTGDDAKLICDILKIPCPDNPSFSGVNLNEQIFVSYPLKGKIYDIVLNKTHACMTHPESKQTNCNVR